MEIKIAREIGYCYGVRDAVDMVIDESQKAGGAPVYTFGPVIHNPHTLGMLERDHNAHVANAIEDIKEPGATVVVRTHGATAEKRAQLEAAGFNIKDGTCPFVLKSHRLARDFVKDGFFLVVLGHRNHAEVAGIVGQVPADRVAIVDKREDLDAVPRQLKIAAIFQSTVTYEDYAWAIPELARRCYEFKVQQTICAVTLTRQRTMVEIAPEVDAMVIIGSRTSSNTKKLVEVVQKHCRVFHIEEPAELDSIDFSGIETVGVGTGTSTPDFLVDQVVERLQAIDATAGKR